jgi:hypothetical protein
MCLAPEWALHEGPQEQTSSVTDFTQRLDVLPPENIAAEKRRHFLYLCVYSLGR